MRFAKCLFLFLTMCFLTSCSGTYRSYVDMFKVALTPSKDNVLTFGQISAASHDFLYLRYGDLPQAALGLRFIENNQLKWLSADNALVVTEHGRIVKTLGLANDLLFTTNLVNDPLKQPRNNAQWLRATDWQSGEYGYAMRSTLTLYPDEQLQFFGQTLSVTRLVEQVSMLDKPPYWRFDETWQNTYWLNNSNGEMIKSVQQLAPGLPAFELVFITEVVRHFNRQGIAIAEDAL